MKWNEYTGIGQEHHVLHVHQDGTILTLDDGSVWDIPIAMTTVVTNWYPSQRVIVRPHEFQSETYALINLDMGGPQVTAAHIRKT
jgi:hypothetical protein